MKLTELKKHDLPRYEQTKAQREKMKVQYTFHTCYVEPIYRTFVEPDHNLFVKQSFFD